MNDRANQTTALRFIAIFITCYLEEIRDASARYRNTVSCQDDVPSPREVIVSCTKNSTAQPEAGTVLFQIPARLLADGGGVSGGVGVVSPSLATLFPVEDDRSFDSAEGGDASSCEQRPMIRGGGNVPGQKQRHLDMLHILASEVTRRLYHTNMQPNCNYGRLNKLLLFDTISEQDFLSASYSLLAPVALNAEMSQNLLTHQSYLGPR